MKLISAIVILFSPDPDLKTQMEEALKTIKAEELKAHGFLCRESIQAILKLKRDGIKLAKK